jgi:flavin reductase (DIM6/NTAB) family NADH-FMN oxidoreductase RutF
MNESDLKKNFLTSMRSSTSTVCVISAKSDTLRHAMTAISVTSLSVDPPSMLVCINKEASIHSIIAVDSSFCINTLSSEQKDIAEICSNSEEGEKRFLNNAWKDDGSYIYNQESLSTLFCECTDLIDHSSHTIVIGRVSKVLNNDDLQPLLYGSGKYLN